MPYMANNPNRLLPCGGKRVDFSTHTHTHTYMHPWAADVPVLRVRSTELSRLTPDHVTTVTADHSCHMIADPSHPVMVYPLH